MYFFTNCGTIHVTDIFYKYGLIYILCIKTFYSKYKISVRKQQGAFTDTDCELIRTYTRFTSKLTAFSRSHKILMLGSCLRIVSGRHCICVCFYKARAYENTLICKQIKYIHHKRVYRIYTTSSHAYNMKIFKNCSRTIQEVCQWFKNVILTFDVVICTFKFHD